MPDDDKDEPQKVLIERLRDTGAGGYDDDDDDDVIFSFQSSLSNRFRGRTHIYDVESTTTTSDFFSTKSSTYSKVVAMNVATIRRPFATTIAAMSMRPAVGAAPLYHSQ